jgi:uncharacterized protein (DUF58 family)
MAGARSTLKLAAALVAAGLLFGSATLFLPGVALGLLAVGAIGWVELAARGVRVEREGGPARVVEGEPYPVRILIRRGAVPPRGELADPLLDEPVVVRAMVGGPERHVSVAIEFERRGRKRLEPAELVVRDPLGLRERAVRSDDGGELLVLPRVEPVTAPGEGGGGAGEGGADEIGEASGTSALEARAVDFEIDGLRPYRKGSPASRIHWPAVARTGELIERRLVAGGDDTPLVVLDAERPEDEESLDRAVRAAASLGVYLARVADGCTLLVPGERRPLTIDGELRAWPAAHARLAVVEAGDVAPPITRVGSTGAIVWVTGRGGRPARALRGLAAPISYLVSPHPLPGIPVSFQVAGCHGQPLRARGRRAAAREAAA